MEKKPSIQNVLQDAAAAVVQQPITLTVNLHEATGFRRLLQRCGLLPRTRALVIRPITLGALTVISRHLLTIDLKLDAGDAILDSTFRLAEKHGATIAEVIALAVHNAPGAPPKALVRVVREHFAAGDLVRALHVVLHQMDVHSFMIAIASVRGLNLLEKSPEASPMTGTETIAPGTSSAVR